MLKKLKAAAAKAALGVANSLGANSLDVAADGNPPTFQYAAKMDRPGRYQKTWVFNQYDDVTAVQFALAGVAPGGAWYGWTINRLLRINYPLPNTLIPMPPPDAPASGDELPTTESSSSTGEL